MLVWQSKFPCMKKSMEDICIEAQSKKRDMKWHKMAEDDMNYVKWQWTDGWKRHTGDRGRREGGWRLPLHSPLSLSKSRSSVEQGLPSCDSGGQDGEAHGEWLLLQLLLRSWTEGVWVSMLRVLLLRYVEGNGARRPSGISKGCRKWRGKTN